MPEDDPELPEVPVEDEPLVLEPPEISDVLPDPLFFSGSGVELDDESLLPVVEELSELDFDDRLGEGPLRPSGRAFCVAAGKEAPGSPHRHRGSGGLRD